ncbi:exosortase/archaeosortase family protein [Opitutus sp. GAS368]|uniref:exosortase/archaeosortase family protein n=1 Tax=Opitutus sp. GAS368 TaxID=1882749 RepID=UPI000879F5EF|nr:exosortase/archaeosortase family protein [Opitutus sp. GAS368]SDS51841.1 exosortase [Opitutus sp. GAS368]
MTSAAPAQPPASARPPADAVAVIALLFGLMAAYSWLLWPEWRTNPDLSHAFFVPVIFLLLVWESRRHGTPRWVPPGRLSVLAVAAAGAAGFIFFALAGLFAATLAWTHAVVCQLLALALASFLLAGVLLLADTRMRLVPFNWISLTAVFLWVLASPLPDGTYARLTLALQHWVTGSVLQTLHLLGVPARQHGNLIELATTTVGVEEACSGIRSLLSCVFAGFFFAGWLVRRPAGRLVLIIVAPLLALGMNFLRSLTLTLMANAGKDISGFWHDATGFAILGVTAAILAGLAILLETKETTTVPLAPPVAPALPRWSLGFFWTAASATLALGVFYVSSARPANHEGVIPPDLGTLLPIQADDWEVRTPNDLYQFADVLQTSHLMERTYLRPAGSGQFTQFTVYVAYWAPGQTSVSRVASHTPDACWPGSGWAAQPVADAHEIPAVPGLIISPGEHRIFKNNAGFSQNVWFWHIYDGRVISYRDPYSIPALFRIALQYGFRRPGDQFFVRISSNRPWAELQDEPLVREILTNLTRIGL